MEDTKQRILEKSLELFSAKGYDAVSVGEIAKAVGIKAPSLYNHKSSRIIVCFLKKGVCQHEKIEANPICNCDSNIAFIYYWWNAGTASSTAFRLVITNHSGYIGLRRCIDNRTSAEIFRQEVRCLGVSMLPFFN